MAVRRRFRSVWAPPYGPTIRSFRGSASEKSNRGATERSFHGSHRPRPTRPLQRFRPDLDLVGRQFFRRFRVVGDPAIFAHVRLARALSQCDRDRLFVHAQTGKGDTAVSTRIRYSRLGRPSHVTEATKGSSSCPDQRTTYSGLRRVPRPSRKERQIYRQPIAERPRHLDGHSDPGQHVRPDGRASRPFHISRFRLLAA